jgi:hypothetical protein
MAIFQELTEFTPEWCEGRKKSQKLNGSSMSVNKETGYLERSSGRGLSAEKKRSLIGSLNQRWNLTKAMKTAEISSRKVVYDHLAIDDLFREHYIEAMERHADEAEDLLIENAKTNPRATAERIFFLKKRRSKIYGDSIEIKGAGADEDLVKRLAESMGKYVIPKDSVVEIKPES